MEDEKVEGVGQDGPGSQVVGVQETSPTPAPAPSMPAATPALSPEVQAEIDRRVEKEYRRLQSIKDREVAAERQNAMRREAAIRQAAKARLEAAGDQNPDEFDRELDTQARLQFADQVIAESEYQKESHREAQKHIRAAGLHKFGVTPDDPRLKSLQYPANDPDGAWEVFDDKLGEIRKEEEAKARAAEKTAAEEAETAALKKRIDSGELSMLGGAPAGVGGGPDLSRFKITDSRELYRLGLQQEQARRGRRG